MYYFMDLNCVYRIRKRNKFKIHVLKNNEEEGDNMIYGDIKISVYFILFISFSPTG